MLLIKLIKGELMHMKFKINNKSKILIKINRMLRLFEEHNED